MRLVFLGVLFSANLAIAEYHWGFGNMSLSYLDWDSGTEGKSTKTDFVYFGIEGGARHSWGDLYGFFDIENVGKTGSETRTASKGAVSYYIWNKQLGVYAHQYSFHSLGFSEQNRVVGLNYIWSHEGLQIKGFLGFHDVIQTYYSGANGYMVGLIIGYSFSWLEQKLLLLNWHEIELNRHETYAAGNGGASGVNGAWSLWWSVTERWILGQQWRYATNKLGTAGDMGAWISTLRYNF